jgi:hypothetical protein
MHIRKTDSPNFGFDSESTCGFNNYTFRFGVVELIVSVAK